MMKKKLFLAVVMMALPLVASAYDAKIDGIYYNLNSSEKTAEVTYLYYNTSTDAAGSKANSNSMAYSGDVKIPSEVTYGDVTYKVVSIGESAFWNCGGITSLEIPNSVTSIGKQAIYYCSGLTSIEIPNSVTSLGERAFQGCRGLTSLVIPNSITTISYRAFCDCRNLTSVVIPPSITSIGERAFWCCFGLTSVTIPDHVTVIGSSAFSRCTSLKSVVIGSRVETIGYWAFEACTELTDIYCNAEWVPTAEANAFYGIHFDKAILHVPESLAGKYKSMSPWRDFSNIQIIDGSVTSLTSIRAKAVTIQADGSSLSIQGVDEGTPIRVYDTTGRLKGSGKASAQSTRISTALRNGEVGIIKIGEKTVKVLMK